MTFELVIDFNDIQDPTDEHFQVALRSGVAAVLDVSVNDVEVSKVEAGSFAGSIAELNAIVKAVNVSFIAASKAGSSAGSSRGSSILADFVVALPAAHPTVDMSQVMTELERSDGIFITTVEAATGKQISIRVLSYSGAGTSSSNGAGSSTSNGAGTHRYLFDGGLGANKWNVCVSVNTLAKFCTWEAVFRT